MPLRVWVEAVGSGVEVDPLIGALRAAGVEVRAAAPDHGETVSPGVLVVEDLGVDGLVARVRDSSRAGVGRVLVVVTGPPRQPDEHPWELLAAGAYDVVSADQEAVTARVRARLSRWAAIDELITSEMVCGRLIGTSRSWRGVLRDIVEIGAFSTANVLVTGQTGTGKELVARLIHELDPRDGKRELVLLDCTTVVPSLAGSEFFGHERGAFTGALGPRDGAFALAHQGTLFLDEVGELPPALQAELLRVVQEGTYKRVGSNHWKRTDFRLICATNRDLLTDEADGGFRADLYYRLAEWRCCLPPLSERREDILALARHFLAMHHPAEMDFDPAVEAVLLARDYPGNVRDLGQLVARIAHRHVGPGPVTIGDLPPEERPAAAGRGQRLSVLFEQAVSQALAAGASLKDIQRAASQTAVHLALEQSDGRVREAASRLEVTPRAVYKRLEAQAQPAPRSASAGVVDLTSVERESVTSSEAGRP